MARGCSAEIIFHVGRCEINNGQTRFDFPEVPVGPPTTRHYIARAFEGKRKTPDAALLYSTVETNRRWLITGADCCWLVKLFGVAADFFTVKRICHKHGRGANNEPWKEWLHCSGPLSTPPWLDLSSFETESLLRCPIIFASLIKNNQRTGSDLPLNGETLSTRRRPDFISVFFDELVTGTLHLRLRDNRLNSGLTFDVSIVRDSQV